MPTEITPQRVQEAVQRGFKRTENFRNARLMYLRNYTGQYYDKSQGPIGTEPLNLIFNAIRILVPNLVMTFPKHTVKAKFLPHRDYAELLGMALDYNAKEINLTEVLRRWVVDSIFCMGILKTGLCESGMAIYFDEDDRIDPGTIYTEIVDLDNLTFDPKCHQLEEAAWIGDRIRVSRTQLLDSGFYRNDLIERLPRSGTEVDDGSEKLSQRNMNKNEDRDLQDFVDIVELWVPGADAIVTVPGCKMTFDEFLRTEDYYGPDEGPYTFLKLTPPVPNNPFPVAPVGIWNDLHVRANIMASKIIDQADRQKDILLYSPGAADDAQELVDAKDGDAIATNDPGGAKIHSFGGQQQSSEAHLQQLMMWFNMMSGNTEALGGIREASPTATQAQILQANQAIGLEDMRDIVYKAVALEGRKRAWYLHTDPLIEVPLIYRRQVPAQYTQGQMGPQMVEPSREEDIQVTLTPEARRGDFLDFHFDIEPKSMSRLDPHMRLQRAMEFAIKIIPAAATAAQICMQMGVAFSFPRFVTRMAKEADIEWMDEVFHDPEFQLRVQEIMMQTPGVEGSQGTAGPKNPAAGIRQNNQPPTVATVPTPQQVQNRDQQMGAADGQSDNLMNDRY